MKMNVEQEMKWVFSVQSLRSCIRPQISLHNYDIDQRPILFEHTYLINRTIIYSFIQRMPLKIGDSKDIVT